MARRSAVGSGEAVDVVTASETKPASPRRLGHCRQIAPKKKAQIREQCRASAPSRANERVGLGRDARWRRSLALLTNHPAASRARTHRNLALVTAWLQLPGSGGVECQAAGCHSTQPSNIFICRRSLGLPRSLPRARSYALPSERASLLSVHLSRRSRHRQGRGPVTADTAAVATNHCDHCDPSHICHCQSLQPRRPRLSLPKPTRHD